MYLLQLYFNIIKNLFFILFIFRCAQVFGNFPNFTILMHYKNLLTYWLTSVYGQ